MVEVKLHDIGEGITEGEIIHYLFKEGDYVKADEPIVEVQTDKMVASLPSPTTGKVKEILIPIGELVSVGTTLLHIEAEGGASVPAPAVAKETDKETTAPTIQTIITTAPAKKAKRVLATPYTRKIARDHNIDIEQVQGTDPSGRVTEEDVYRFIQSASSPNPSMKEVVTAPSAEAGEGTETLRVSKTTDSIPFRGMRKQIAKKMVKSLFTIPHVTHFEEVDMTNLLHLKDELKKAGTSVSVSAFFLKALVISLKDFPVFNAKLDEENERIILEREYNIGLATDTEDGLIVPVLHDADKKTLSEINSGVKQLGERAKNGKLTLADFKNSTFTVSNVGPLGSIGATPIINHPETALVAFHKTKKQPVVNEREEIVIRSMMNMSMSFDHRVADGATAVAFTNRFKELIEQPNKLLLEMV